MSNQATQLFEISWEVCNKVGGIHTVITSKLPQALQAFPDRYLAIGPYLPGTSMPEFQEQALPASLVPVAKRVAEQGIVIHYGTWLVNDEPPVVLIDWSGMVGQRDSLKATYWERYKLDTLGSDFYDLDQPMLWSTAVGMFVEAFVAENPGQAIAHGHEWLASGLFLHLGLQSHPSIHTVFTTHATVLGRSLCSHNVFIYDKLSELDPTVEARNYGVTSKHQLEKLAATLATVFTTVSQVTANEATAFLGRRPEVVTENGLDTEEFPAFDALCIYRSHIREKLDDFVSAYFFPSYRFDLAHTSYQFTTGRYESHNKGYDVYIESLGQLNRQLKKEKSKKTVVSFLLVATGSKGVRPEVATQLMVYRRIVTLLSQVAITSQRDVYRELWEHSPDHSHHLLDPELHETIRHLTSRIHSPEAPGLSPFVLYNEQNDDITKLAAQHGLTNKEEDPVKVVFLPVYLDGFDGIFNIPLYELLSGFDLGVFPSLYEPWGYTPMESLALGVPAITSNLAGFGLSLPTRAPKSTASFVLDRHHLGLAQSIETLTGYLAASLRETPRQWLSRRMDAYSTIQAFSWDKLYPAYEEAYRLASSNQGGE